MGNQVPTLPESLNSLTTKVWYLPCSGFTFDSDRNVKSSFSYRSNNSVKNTEREIEACEENNLIFPFPSRKKKKSILIYRYDRISGQKILILDGNLLYRKINRVDAGDLIYFDIKEKKILNGVQTEQFLSNILHPTSSNGMSTNLKDSKNENIREQEEHFKEGKIKNRIQEKTNIYALKVEDFPGLDSITLGKYIEEVGMDIKNDSDLTEKRHPKILNFDHISTSKFLFVPSIMDVLSSSIEIGFTWEAKLLNYEFDTNRTCHYIIQTERKDQKEEEVISKMEGKDRKDKEKDQQEYYSERSEERSKTYIVKRRFKEFSQLDTDMRSLYRDHQLYSNLPSLPPSYNTISVDHTDSTFLEKRQAALQSYLTQLLNTPHATSSPDLVFFLTKVDSKYLDPFTRLLRDSVDNDSIYDIL